MIECEVAFGGCAAPIRARYLRSHAEKLRGLIGAREGSGAVILESCRSIHTFGMRVALDVAFVDERGRVAKSLRRLPPARVAASPGAWLAIERPASDEPWPARGESLVALTFCSTAEEGGGRHAR